jgi:hypothetical protein
MDGVSSHSERSEDAIQRELANERAASASDRRRAGLINRGANDGALQRRRFLIAG